MPGEVTAVAVRWCLRYGLSDRDVEELLAERGATIDHVTIYRWVQTLTPEFIDVARPARHAARIGGSWTKPTSRCARAVSALVRDWITAGLAQHRSDSCRTCSSSSPSAAALRNRNPGNPFRRCHVALARARSRLRDRGSPPGLSRWIRSGRSNWPCRRARGPLLPPWCAAGLLYPLVQLWSFPLLQAGDLDVAGPASGSERRRGVEVRAAEEDDIHGNIVGG
jgi:hypothetical protein